MVIVQFWNFEEVCFFCNYKNIVKDFFSVSATVVQKALYSVSVLCFVVNC